MSINFNGTNQLISMASPTALDNIWATGGTLSAWINPAGWGEGDLGRIVDKTAGAPSSNDGWAFYVALNDDTDGNAQSIAFMHTNNAGSNRGIWASPDSSISLDTWYHVAITFDKDNINNTPLLYIDGASVTVEEKDSPGGSSFESDAANNFVVASRNDEDHYFEGRVEAMRVYSRVLSAAEIATIFYARGSDFILEGLVANWPMFGFAAGTAATGASSIIDISGNALHGTPTASPTYEESTINPFGVGRAK